MEVNILMGLYFFSPAKFSRIARAMVPDLSSLHMQSIKSSTILQMKARKGIDPISDFMKQVELKMRNQTCDLIGQMMLIDFL